MVHSVYKPHNAALKAHCIYLYYFTANSCDAVYEDFGEYVAPSDIPQRISLLVQRIKSLDRTLKHTKTCERKSYFAVALDDRPHRLKGGNAVKIRRFFFPGKGTFRDGRDVPALPNHTDISAFFCFNHMRHRLGHDLKKGQSERFSVTLVHDHPSLWRSYLTGWVGYLVLLGWLFSMFSHDDSGTNMGPPLGPP